MFTLLYKRRLQGDGWVARNDLLALWKVAFRPRTSAPITNAIENLREQIAGKLSWAIPHFTIVIDGDPQNRATRYRLSIIRREAPWDFVGNEAPRTIPFGFKYKFNGDSPRIVGARVWAISTPNRPLEIEAVRETPNATWTPHSHATQYRKERDDFFLSESKRLQDAGHRRLRNGDLWGIVRIEDEYDTTSSILRIRTTRTRYQDLVFLKNSFDLCFPALPKIRTYREWLGVDSDPREGFCPPRDALCVAVVLVCEKPRPTVFVAKSRHHYGTDVVPWALTADGAAASSHLTVDEEKPDLIQQVKEVLFRETGVRANASSIEWLGFARRSDAGDSSVIALVRSLHSVSDILDRFRNRREQDDLEEILPVQLSALQQWMHRLKSNERTELLELGLALTAIRLGEAVVA